MIKENLLYFANILIDAYFMAMIFYILSSWVPPLRESRLGQFVGSLVEPYLGIFRRIIPPIGMIDISPIFALLTYQYVIEMFAYEGLKTILDWIL